MIRTLVPDPWVQLLAQSCRWPPGQASFQAGGRSLIQHMSGYGLEHNEGRAQVRMVSGRRCAPDTAGWSPALSGHLCPALPQHHQVGSGLTLRIGFVASMRDPSPDGRAIHTPLTQVPRGRG